MNRTQFPATANLIEGLCIGTALWIIRKFSLHKGIVQKCLHCGLRVIGRVKSQLLKLENISFGQKIARIHMIRHSRLRRVVPAALAWARVSDPPLLHVGGRSLDQALVPHLLRD